MSKTWYTASEFADLKLPGLPDKRNRMVEFIAKFEWATRCNAAGEAMARKRSGRGGGLEYHVGLLPTTASLEMVEMGLLEASYAAANDAEPIEALPAAPAKADWNWYAVQSAKTKADAEARLKVIQAVEAAEAAGMKRNSAVAHAAKAHGVSGATIWNWIGLLKGIAPADRLPALAPRRKGGGVKAEYDERIYKTFESHFLEPGPRTFEGSFYYTKRWAKTQGLEMPHVKTLTRRLRAEVPREVMIASKQGMKALMETVVSQRRTVKDLRAMDLINIDGHKLDVFVYPPKAEGSNGAPMRAILIAMQDVYSRKILAWRLCGEESIFHTRLCFADLFRKWGLPGEVLMDNGRAFASKYLTGGTKTRFRGVVKEDEPWGLLPQLGIKNYFATPEHGQAKPIERAFGDLVKFIAMHPACQGAYTGNRVDRKPHDYGSRAMAWEDLSVLVDEMIGEYNAHRGRRTEMARATGASFDDVFNESYEQLCLPKGTREQIDMALLEAKTHRCDAKTGEIRMLGNRYFSPVLYNWAGKEVSIRFDPDNLHAPIQVYQTTGQRIGEAPAIEDVGFRNAEAAKQIAKQRKDMRKLARQLIEAEDLISASELAAMQPRANPDDQAPVPQPAAVRLVRSRGNSAAALKIISEGQPVQDCAAPISLFTTAMERENAQVRQHLTLFDGGLSNPQQEPERPK